MADKPDLKELFPDFYEAYLQLLEDLPEGLSMRPEYLGENGFARWLELALEIKGEPDDSES